MRYRLEKLGSWISAAILLGGMLLLLREYPVTVSVLVGGATLALLACTAWYDFAYWKRKYLLWKHAALLTHAAAIVNQHIDVLAARMGEVLKWDGRWDYDWAPWIDISREFVEKTVIPALEPAQQRIIADCGPVLREEIRRRASGHVFSRAQQLRLVI